MPDPVDLDRIEALCNDPHLPPAPWWCVAMAYHPELPGFFYGPRPPMDQIISGEWFRQKLVINNAVADLIVAAPKDIPALVNEIRRLRAVLVEERKHADRIRTQIHINTGVYSPKIAWLIQEGVVETWCNDHDARRARADQL